MSTQDGNLFPGFSEKEVEYLKTEWLAVAARKTEQHGVVIYVTHLIFTDAIFSDVEQYGYGDRWCYEKGGAALAAMLAWDTEKDAEPSGWHRHPATGRRRPNGDKSKEYINA